MNIKKTIIFIVFLGIIIIFPLINSFIKSKKEFETGYDFVIDKIEIAPTKSMVLFDGNKKIRLWNYIIGEKEDVRVGDKVYKEKCSKYLYIYRKNKQGIYKEHLRFSALDNWPKSLTKCNE